MGILDIFGGDDDDSAPQILEAFPGQQALTGELAEAAKPGALDRLGRAGEAYPGQLTAGLSEFEQLGLGTLGDYLSSELPTEGGLFQAAKGELLKTLEGGYDPNESQYWQAYQQNVQRLAQEAQDKINAQTSARDKYFGGGRIAVSGELQETVTGNLQQELGRLFEAERERRLGAVDPAMRLTTFEELAPLARVEASQQFGGLPRQIEQGGLDRNYNEWIRQLNDLGIPLDVATGLATYKADFWAPEAATGGGFGDMASTLAQLFAQSGDSGGGGGGGGDQGGLTGGGTQQDIQLAMMLASMCDARFKENVKPIKNAVEKVKQLSGYTYNFKDKTNRDGGIMAQDIEKVMPEAVEEVNGIKMVKFASVIGLLVEAIKEITNGRKYSTKTER